MGGEGQPSFVSIFVASTLPSVSVHFCRARRAWQKCTETRGKVDAINIETKEGGPPPWGGHNALSALGDFPPTPQGTGDVIPEQVPGVLRGASGGPGSYPGDPHAEYKILAGL